MEKHEDKKDSLKARTAKGLLWGGFSNILTQILGFVFGIVLGRILTPNDYGLIGMITIFSVIAAAFQESGFVNGIANKKEVQHKDYNAVFWCSISIGTILYFILFFSTPYIALYFNSPELKDLARVAFLSFWFGSFGIAHNAYLFRNLMLKERAITLFLSLIISNIIGIILALNGFAYWGLAIQTIIYSLTTSVLYAYFSKFKPSFQIDFSPIKSIIGFSSKILVTNIFIHINNNIFTVILGRYYKADDVGNITQANKWNLMSQSLISNMVNSIVQPVLNQMRDDQDRQTRVFRKILAFTAFLTFPGLFGLSIVSEEFILMTIKEKWLESADYLSILSIGGAFAVISNVFSHLILSKGDSKLYMYSIISFGVAQVIVLLLSKDEGVMTMIVLSVLLQFIWLFIWFLLAKPFVNYSIMNLGKDVFSYALFAAIAAILTQYLTSGLDNIYLLFVTKLICMATIYALANRLLLPTILLEIWDYGKTILRKNK